MDLNTILTGDNLTILKTLPSASVDLIYLDPPFNKGRTFTDKKGEFDDKFTDRQSYLDFLHPRLMECHRVLKRTGSLYFHCDHVTSHIIRMLLEDVFGQGNFKNEIIWVRNNGRTQRNKYEPKGYGRSHDTIFLFGKTDKAFFDAYANAKPLTLAYLGRYNHRDDKGAYGRFPPFRGITLGKQPSLEYEFKGITPPDDTGGWLGTRKHMEAVDKAGDLEMVDGKLWHKRRPGRGIILGSVWTDIKRILDDERTDYPTQKPLKLMERIIKASSKEGDLILDGFCGSGSACLAARNLGRKYIGIDSNPDAVAIAQGRLKEGGLLSLAAK